MTLGNTDKNVQGVCPGILGETRFVIANKTFYIKLKLILGSSFTDLFCEYGPTTKQVLSLEI